MKIYITNIIKLLVSIFLIYFIFIFLNLITLNFYNIPQKNLNEINKIKNIKLNNKIEKKNDLFYFLNKEVPNLTLKEKNIKLKDILQNVISNHFYMYNYIYFLNYYGIKDNLNLKPRQLNYIYELYNINILKKDGKNKEELKEIISSWNELHKSLEQNYKKLVISKNNNIFKIYQKFLDNLELKKEKDNAQYDNGGYYNFFKINRYLGIYYFNNLLYNKNINKIIKGLNILEDTNNSIIRSKNINSFASLKFYSLNNELILNIIEATIQLDEITPIQKKELLKIINKIIKEDEKIDILKYIKIKQMEYIPYFTPYFINENISFFLDDKFGVYIENVFWYFVSYNKINTIYSNFVISYYNDKIYLKSKEENINYANKIAKHNIYLKQLFDPIFLKKNYENISILDNKINNLKKEFSKEL